MGEPAAPILPLVRWLKPWHGNTNDYFAVKTSMTAAVIRPVTIKIDEDTRARVKRLAEARHRTPHWLMREAIAKYVERDEKREAFRQDALKAWEAHRATGLHVTAAEADAWLAQLEQGNGIEPPACSAYTASSRPGTSTPPSGR